STSVVTSSPIASRYSSVERRLEMSFFIRRLRGRDSAPAATAPSRQLRTTAAVLADGRRILYDPSDATTCDRCPRCDVTASRISTNMLDDDPAGSLAGVMDLQHCEVSQRPA